MASSQTCLQYVTSGQERRPVLDFATASVKMSRLRAAARYTDGAAASKTLGSSIALITSRRKCRAVSLPGVGHVEESSSSSVSRCLRRSSPAFSRSTPELSYEDVTPKDYRRGAS